jgi:hypothetical protein
MNPVITISKTILAKRPESEVKILEFAQKIKEINNVIVYMSQSGNQLVELIIFLKASKIHFEFYATEDELKKLFIKSDEQSETN